MRRRAAAISARDAGRAAAGAADRRRAGAPRRDAERDARPAARPRSSASATFVADAGHELRTPLALLRTELELALAPRRLVGRSCARRSAGRRTRSDRLSQLAEDLLLIARARPRAAAAAGRAVPVDDAVRGRARAASSGARAELRARRWRRPPAGALLVEAATGSGSSRRSATSSTTRCATAETRSGSRRRAATARSSCTCATTATGFPPALLRRAFERFTRADAARSSGGAGLGLSIVQAIAESHHGSAHVANRGRGGADTWISLPIPNALGPA